MVKRYIRHIALVVLMLLLGGMVNEAWAYKVTYHVLTLPMDHTKGNTIAAVDDKRVEAIRTIVDDGLLVELPSNFKSPLAKNFTYYASTDINTYSAAKIYANNNTKYVLYDIKGAATPLVEGSAVASDCDIYVTYEYDEDNTIAKLDGSKTYNITIGDGFLALNRGRNNRPAVIPKQYVSAEQLTSEDFVKVDVSKVKSNAISAYWNDATKNKNPREKTESQFYFRFKYLGEDPYNITISAAFPDSYDEWYVEKESYDAAYVRKYYKGATIFGQSTATMFVSSEVDQKYTTEYTNANETLVETTSFSGFYRNYIPIWNSFAMLNAGDDGGYVFMASRYVKKDTGVLDFTETKSGGKYQYYFLWTDHNNLQFKLMTVDNAVSKYATDDEMYEIKDVNFKITTPFYNPSGTDEEKAAHTLTATIKLSEYTMASSNIDLEDIPESLKRKYCTFNGKFYKDAAHTQQITKYSQLTDDIYDIYVDYDVSASLPFETITPAASYSAATWTAATWYELTDEGSIQENGKKLKYDGSTYFKNNGPGGEYLKTSEFAFIGDPYELRVISRSLTSGATPYYLGAAGTPPGTGTDFTASTTATEGFLWEIPYEATGSSFLLRKLNDTGYWYWNANHLSKAISYGTNDTFTITNGNVQTVTFNISGLTYESGHYNYIKVTKGGTDVGQVTSTTPELTDGIERVLSDGTVMVSANIAANTSGADKTFTLTIQEYDGSNDALIGTATVITVTQEHSTYAGDAVEYNTSLSTRIKVMELPKQTFTYKIVDKSGRVAVKASIDQTIYSPLSLASIPSIIVSPFLVGETLTFYGTYTLPSNSRTLLTDAINETPNANHDIYVKYTTTALDAKPIKLSEDQEFNVKLNGKYIYYDSESNKIKSADEVTDIDNDKKYYLWKLRGRDPYSMMIDNIGARISTDPEYPDIYDDNGTKTNPQRQPGGWVKFESDGLANGKALVTDGTRANAQRFIAKSSLNQGIYEVMVATGDDVDASTTYYNIGRTEDLVKIYYNNTASGGYAHGNAALAFNLDQTIVYTYYLIDKAKHKLLEIETKSADLVLPAEYQSPLVSSYNYYASDNITITHPVSGDEYTPTDPAATIDNLEAVYTKTSGDYASAWSAADETHQKTATDEEAIDEQAKQLKSTGHFYFRIGETSTYYDVNVTKAFHDKIYVTYEKNDLVTFNDDASPYMLKFLNPYATGYFLEDGNDKLTSERIQAVYPYCNGDGSLNIYGTAMNKEQMDGGSSTRPRWTWFFQSDNNDPYHVKIHSKSTISYKSVSHPTYLQTYAVHFNQDVDADTKHVVTGGSLPGIASTNPTEYMILGTEGHYKLVTTDVINDGVSIERRTVNSFEQYWKTYNMLKLHVLGINKNTNAFSNDESTWVVPTSGDYRTTIAARDWHSYDAIAYAVRWNGYNDKSDGHEKKVVEKLEHWFQTFDMGDGTFDIESADIPPVLVLLDRHGWEIMRKPLPSSATYPYGEALEALKAYDSPMVKEYKFYSNATKGTGCHKYALRMQNGAERDQIKVNGKHYTSTSLADLPPVSASGVKSSGAFNDQFVTYTVKEEYEKSYSYHLELHEEDSTYTESGTATKFLILQNGRFARDNSAIDANTSYLSKPIRQGSNIAGDNGEVYDMILDPTSTYADTNSDGKIDDINLWYVGPNLNIDKEMGIKWSVNKGQSLEPHTEYETKKEYKDKTGFDPYNIQLQNAVENGKYLTTHITSTALSGGALVGDYTDGSKNVTLEDWVDVHDRPAIESNGNEGYDHTYIQMTNQTFMAVQDANGNMQLMPRFDHTQRINVNNTAYPYATTLADPVDHTTASVDNWRSMGTQTVFLVRPQVYEYHIIDNQGRESLCYKTAGTHTPYIPNHFKSPLATDFKFYYDHAAYTAAASSKTSYDAAATSGYFKKEAVSVSAMETAVKALTVVDNYYFNINSGESYKKVTVTKAHSGSTDATYTFTDCTKDDYDNAVAYQQSAVSEAAMQTAVLSLTNKGFYYYQIGSGHYAYKKVVRSGGTNTITISDAGHYSGDLTATDDADFETKAKALSSDGTYYYKIGLLYNYQKVVVTNVASNIISEIAAKKDISDKEITGTFAEADLNALNNDVYVRYSYNPSADDDGILQGKWFTITLASKNVQSSGTINRTDGTGVSLFADDNESNKKPSTINATEETRKWQWKFLAAPVDPSSEYYGTLDPYAVQIFNRAANYTTDLSLDPNPMGVGIKVNDCDRFALLSHPSGGYALAVTGGGYTYSFLNGASMTVPSTTAATTTAENTSDTETYHFTVKSCALSAGAQLLLNDDVTHNYTYKIVTNENIVDEVNVGNKLAVSATQDDAAAELHSYTPYLPEDIQTPLLNTSDYLYYGSALENSGTYTVVPATELITLYGLYNDEVYVRYNAYSMDNNADLKVPNKRNTPGTTVAKADDSKDAAMNIDGGLPYNIIWEADNIMKRGDDDAISYDANHALSGDAAYVWLFEGNDPYALKIKHKNSNKYVVGASNLSASATKTFMLLRKDGYDYGILQETCGTNKLTGYGQSLTASAPTKFIIFGLSTHKVIYHLVINTTGENTSIPYRSGSEAEPGSLTSKDIPGTTQRDLTSSIFGVQGDRYQLGSTIMGQTYCVDAGQVSVGDELKVPNEFKRANCNYFFYVDNIQTVGEIGTYQYTVASEDAMNTNAAAKTALGDYYYKIESQYVYRKVHVVSVSPAVYEISASTALEYTDAGSSLTATDEAALITAANAIAETGDYYYRVGTIDLYKRARVTTANDGANNAVYTVVDCTEDDWTNAWQDNSTLNGSFKGLEITRLMSDSRLIGSAVKINIAYAFQTGLETNAGEGFVTSTDQNLWYTLETKNGTTPHLAQYTNAWGLQAKEGRDTRYTNDYLWTPLGDVYGFKMYNRYMIKNSGGVHNVMTMSAIREGQHLLLAEPGTGGYTSGNEVFELLGAYTDGYFLVHPVINKIGTQYYVKRHDADTDVDGDSKSDLNYAVLSTGYSEWTFNLNPELLKPYIERVGYVGGLKETVYTANKTVLDKVMDGTASYADMLEAQGIVYDDNNIVTYTPGYYRLHSQPGVSSISPVRYASGYLHDIEKTAVAGGIPMHFYSKQSTSTTFGSTGLKSGYTSTNATRGDIPVPSTENDPSTIFYFDGTETLAGNPRSTMQAQGLYVVANANGDEDNGTTTSKLQRAVMSDNSANAITFSLMDIGGAVLLIHDGSAPTTRRYLNFDQSNATDIYDLKYYHDSPTDDAKWCMQPVQKTATAGTNEMGLSVATNNGGDGYYYTTFYAPFDVLLPNDAGGKTYYAYIGTSWSNTNVRTAKVEAHDPYVAGKFVPAGTPVIIRTNDNSESINLSLPLTAPTSPAISCPFTGQYLEQLLAVDADHDVYTFGLPFTSGVTINRTTGEITAELVEQAKSGVGFYINATENKEANELHSLWQRNNRYVLHNKVYYRAAGGGSAPQLEDVQFVPVVFGDDINDKELMPDGSRQMTGDNCIYDLQGRKVVTIEQVQDGTWQGRLAPGIYILNGRKFQVR